MRLDASGHLIEINARKIISCTACDGRLCAERLSSTPQDKGIAYHNYHCQREDCPAGGTIVERETGEPRYVGSVFRAPRSHRPTYRDDHPAADTVSLTDRERDRDSEEPEKPAVERLEARS